MHPVLYRSEPATCNVKPYTQSAVPGAGICILNVCFFFHLCFRILFSSCLHLCHNITWNQYARWVLKFSFHLPECLSAGLPTLLTLIPSHSYRSISISSTVYISHWNKSANSHTFLYMIDLPLYLIPLSFYISSYSDASFLSSQHLPQLPHFSFTFAPTRFQFLSSHNVIY